MWSAQFLRSATVKGSRKGFALTSFSRLVRPVVSAVLIFTFRKSPLRGAFPPGHALGGCPARAARPGGRQPHASLLPKLVCDAQHRTSPDPERLGHLQDTHTFTGCSIPLQPSDAVVVPNPTIAPRQCRSLRAATAPPSSVKNSRRFIRDMGPTPRGGFLAPSAHHEGMARSLEQT